MFVKISISVRIQNFEKMNFSRQSPMRQNIKLSKLGKDIIFKNTQAERNNFNKGKFSIFHK